MVFLLCTEEQTPLRAESRKEFQVRPAIVLHGLNGKEIRELTQLENKNPHQRGFLGRTTILQWSIVQVIP